MMGTFLPIVIVLAVACYLVFIYNRLVHLRQAYAQALSDIDVQYRQRLDLVPNLVETVRAYASHERETLTAVISARAAAAADASPSREATQGALAGALRRLIGVAEAYPDLKANQNFLALQAELSDIERKIAAARRFHNMAVAEYNGATAQFPTLLFARAFGFEATAFFAIGDADRELAEKPPAVKF
jgi:LemA protein